MSRGEKAGYAGSRRSKRTMTSRSRRAQERIRMRPRLAAARLQPHTRTHTHTALRHRIGAVFCLFSYSISLDSD